MADQNLISAIARGLSPPQVVGTIARTRAAVQQLIATNQIADEQALRALYAANAIQTPGSIDLIV